MPAARNEPARRVGPLSFVLSVGVHAATFVGLGAFPLDPPPKLDEVVEVSLVQEPAPAPEPEPVVTEPAPETPQPVPDPAPVKPPPKAAERAPRAPKTPPPPSSAPPAPAQEEVADFSGTTLTGQGGWASAVGTGGAMDAPIGSPDGVNTGRQRAGVAGGVVGGTGVRVVPEGDLSRRPKPPSADVLNAALEKSYPKSARQQGIGGKARIRIRVLASGKLQPLATLSETYPGFAESCKTSLREMTFQPGLDGTGQPVATDIVYSCDFNVE